MAVARVTVDSHTFGLALSHDELIEALENAMSIAGPSTAILNALQFI